LKPLEILYEDNHLIAISKPAGLPTMGVAEGEESAVTIVKEYLKQKYEKPGNVYLGVVSRLDRLVTGVLIFARTSKAAKRLNEQIRSRSPEKRYEALVSGESHVSSGKWVDWVYKDEKLQKMLVRQKEAPGCKLAELLIEEAQRIKIGFHVKIKLITGRKHQIRVQLASRRLPILGDSKYGSRHVFPGGIALHSTELLIQHPVSRENLTIRAKIPKVWQNIIKNENRNRR